ncbi:MAG: nucleotide sugar dehydrogenase [Thermoplasmata archaeon]|nr:MAG: nucleotide sugar dehydrogenase [Thermoplasmata archaeon]
MVALEDLLGKISSGSAKVGIIGLGYVGLPLAMTMSRRFKVVGYDKSSEIIKSLSEGKSPVTDVKDSLLAERLGEFFSPSGNEQDLEDCDFLIICVPTPLDTEKKPDLSYIKSACNDIKEFLKKGQFIILESTTYPGTTEEVMVPLLEKSGLKAGTDFGVAYSPERVDPGNKKYSIEKIPKVVGGVNETCTEIVAKLYESVLEVEVIKARNCRTAEASKIVENIFRDVNIALANELALVFEKMDIDAWEVIKIASTKPFGFMPFYPGPGVGGHCIPVDPYYLSYQARKYDIIPRFIELSGEINDFMPVHVTNLLRNGLKQVNKEMAKATIAILGITYKKDVNDTRESPARIVIEQIVSSGGNVKIFDPFAKEIETKHGIIGSESSAEDAVKDADALVILVDHSIFSKEMLSNLIKTIKRPIIVDCKNILKDGLEGICEDGLYFGIGKPKLQ